MSTQNKYLDFKGLSYFYDNVIKKHDVFFYTYYKTHPEEIVNLPKEIIYKYFPDILMIIEPLNGSVMLPKSTTEKYTITTTNGLITKDMVREAAEALDMEIDVEFKLATYNCSAIRYCNLYGFDNARLRPQPSNTVWTSYTEEPENKLGLVEGLVGWKDLSYNFLDWWTEPEYSTTKRQVWWDDKITINGDWYLSDGHIINESPNWFKITNFMRLEGLEATIEREIEFNGNIYFPSRIAYAGCGWMFTNLRCYQYPTLDFTRYKKTGEWPDGWGGVNNYEKGQYLGNFIKNRKFTWVPERPQKCLIKGMGYGMRDNGAATIAGIIDWDYDDMIASLITYANNSIENPGGSLTGVRFDISQTSYDKLTEDDLAAIVAMGNSVAVVDSNV